MIPSAQVNDWRRSAPWQEDPQVEQDLIVSKALVQLFLHPVITNQLGFRGGTALYKLHLGPIRYSEDIDLVQRDAGPAGPMISAIQEVLNPWLGTSRRKQGRGRITFVYRFNAGDAAATPLRVKIEINTREHFSILGYTRRRFAMDSCWFAGSAEVVTYELEELLGTKLRALYQRKKGRNLFDLSTALENTPVETRRILKVFSSYMNWAGHHVTRRMFEMNLETKLDEPGFGDDVLPVLAIGQDWNIQQAAQTVSDRLVSLLPHGRHDTRA